MAEASDFKFGMQDGFAKTHHEIPHRRMTGRGPVLYELPKILGFPLIFVQRLKLATSNLAWSWGSPRPIIKTTTKGKGGRDLGLGKLPNICGSPLILLQRPPCHLSVSGASCYFIVEKRQVVLISNVENNSVIAQCIKFTRCIIYWKICIFEIIK